ncbi:MAG: hypothetical protein LBQ38_10490 [Spirochaetaceae bacterium]|jgi:hypothetical protein|nr:hypothetical protein [Spirochaetaceae bacterium]
MKKVLLLFWVLAIGGASAFAFDILSFPPPVQGGNFLVDVGIGLNMKSGYTMKIPPLAVGVEYALPVNVPVSVGGMFALYQYGHTLRTYDKDTEDLIRADDETWTYFTGGVRGNWHWGFDIKWLDFYSGIFLGWEYGKWKWDGPNNGYSQEDYSQITGGFQAGAHFYFSKNVGVVAEAGFPFFLKAG